MLLTATVIPSAALLFAQFSYLHAAIHILLVMVISAETYMAMLHNASHTSLYRPRFYLLNGVIPYLLGPFFGQTINGYFFHHIKHHHVEDNGVRDLSSTESYQRDSILAFLHYFLRFFLFVAIELPFYFFRNGRISWGLQAMFGEFLTLLLFGVCTYANVRAGLAVFVIPFCAMRFGMMAANWGQHAFINPDRKKAHSVTILESSYNSLAFNDGFHHSHHRNSLRHWSEHSVALPASLDNITLKGDINFGDLWLMLMWKDYAQIERMLVFTGEKEKRPSKQAIIRELKRQLAPVS